MPNFKPKANKKFKMNKKTTTLDSKHNEKMREFDKIENKLIPAWKEERRKLRLAKDKAENIVDKLKMADTIQDLTKKIRKNRKLRKSYLLQNSQYIFDRISLNNLDGYCY